MTDYYVHLIAAKKQGGIRDLNNSNLARVERREYTIIYDASGSSANAISSATTEMEKGGDLKVIFGSAVAA